MKRATITGFGATALAACGLFAGQPDAKAIHREGRFWVQVHEASEGIGPAAGLEIKGTGSVLVRGGGPGMVHYKLTRRVRAVNLAEARRRLDDLQIEWTVRNHAAVLALSGRPETDLEVTAPRGLRFLTVNTQAGNLDIADLEGPVNLQTGAGKVAVNRVRGTVVIDTAGGVTSLGDIGGLVRIDSAGGGIVADILRGGAILQTAGGDITVQHVAGPVRAFTAGGGIRIREAGNTVMATTVGGPIEVRSARGAVTARNSGGPIQVTSAQGARCESASGSIRLEDVSGAVHVETQSGSVIARLLPGQQLLDSFISTTAGDITVFIPSEARLTLQAENERSEVRSIVSDFPGLSVRSDGRGTRGDEVLNGGGPMLRLAGNGLIFIKRR